MKKLSLVIILIIFSCLTYSQPSFFNVRDYGAKGDGQTDDFIAINNLINHIRLKIQQEEKKCTLYFPEGTYLIGQTLVIPKLLDIKGEKNHRSIIKVDNDKIGAIEIARDELFKKFDTWEYNEITNLVFYGPDHKTNPFAWKDENKNNPNSVGIKILGIRNRITNCLIRGFLWAGIETSGSYYNFITDSFISNNRVGVLINKTSTSAYLNNNEFRVNSIAIHIANNSFGNFINNNMIESNIANYLAKEVSENDTETLKRGKGVLIENAKNNFINNNYFEQQYVNIALYNANNNSISDNFFAIGSLVPYKGSNQVLIKFFNNCTNNNFLNNKLLTPSDKISPYNIVVNDIKRDYSSNVISFSPSENNIVREKLTKKYGIDVLQIP